MKFNLQIGSGVLGHAIIAFLNSQPASFLYFCAKMTASVYDRTCEDLKPVICLDPVRRCQVTDTPKMLKCQVYNFAILEDGKGF